MKSLFITSCLLLFFVPLSFGQIGIRLFNYRPLGEFGFTMKPLTSVEIGYQGKFDDRLRASMSIAYLNMKPRLDVFPVNLIENGGSSNPIIRPATQVFKQYALFQLAMGADYSFLWKEKYSFYVGADLIGGPSSVNYEVEYQGVLSRSENVGAIFVGYRARLGFEYELTEKIGVFVNANRIGVFVGEPRALLGAIDFGVGIRYSFN